jgi:hypothetical protein
MLLRAIVFPSYVNSINKWLIRLVPMQAFPAGSGPRDRTTYMFTYLDATPNRPSLEQMLEDYWDLMPPYQGIKLEDVEILRVLFGLFPTYRSRLIFLDSTVC